MDKKQQKVKKTKPYKARRAIILSLVVLTLTLFSLNFIDSATWTESFNENLMEYWTFDSDLNGELGISDCQGPGNTRFNSGGIINGYVNFTGGGDGTSYLNCSTTGSPGVGVSQFANVTDQFTLSWWVNPDPAPATGFMVVMTDQFPQGSSNDFISRTNLNADNTVLGAVITGAESECASCGAWADSGWQQMTWTYNGINNTFYIDGVRTGGQADTGNVAFNSDPVLMIGAGAALNPNSPMAGSIDEVGVWNKSMNTSMVEKLYNSGAGLVFVGPGGGEGTTVTVNLSAPVNDTEIINSSLDFFANFNVTKGNFTNSTLFVWNSNTSLFATNTTNITGDASNLTNASIDNLVIGSTYLWNYQACVDNSTDIVCSFANSNRTFSRKEYSEESIGFISRVNETSAQNFSINITTLDVILSVTANLIYNGTSYPSSVSCTLPQCTISNRIDVPLTINGKGNSQNKSFFWNISTTSSTQSFNSVTNTQEQNVSRIWIAPCNSSLSTRLINFSTLDAINPNPPINATFKSTWSYWLGTGNTRRNNSYENISEMNNSFVFCGSPYQEIRTTAEFEFDAINYEQNHHYYFEQNFSTTNVTEQKLYLLESGNATLTIIKVIDDLQRGLENRLVEIILFDVGTGEEKVISMARTDHIGEDIVYLNWFDSFYRIKIRFNGNLELEVDPYKIGSTPQRFEIIPLDIFPQDKFGNVLWSLTFNNVTNEFVLIFNDPFKEIAAGCMRVVKSSASNYTILSDQCINSTSGTLSYNIGNQTGVFLAAFYSLGSFGIIDTLMIIIETAENIFNAIGNLDASIMALILVGTATFFGLLVSGVVGILMLAAGYIVALALGYQNMEMLSTFLPAAALGVYLMWKLRT